MTLQLYRPAVPLSDEDDHRYAVVINDGEGGIEFYDQAGAMHDVPTLDEDSTGVADWVEVSVAAVEDALNAAAELAAEAGKTRTAEWLRTCARLGFNQAWPDAPAYKGAVVHIDEPAADLAALTDEQLNKIERAAVAELFRRNKNRSSA